MNTKKIREQTRERAKKYRDRMREMGQKQVAVFLSETASAYLEHLVQTYDKTQNQIIEQAMVELYEKTITGIAVKAEGDKGKFQAVANYLSEKGWPTLPDKDQWDWQTIRKLYKQGKKGEECQQTI